MSEISCRDFFSGMEDRFNSEAAGALKAVFQFNLVGEAGGEWAVEVEDGSCRVSEGRAQAPTLTATMSSSDFEEMINGRLAPQAAFMSGRLSIRPMNLELAQAFGRMFF